MRSKEEIEKKIHELWKIVYDELGNNYIWDIDTANVQMDILEWVLEEEVNNPKSMG